MDRRGLIGALAAFIASSAAAAAPKPAKGAQKPAPETPANVVRDLYAELPRPVSMRRLSQRLRTLLRQDQARRERNLDFEWRSGGQERPAITDLRIHTIGVGKDKAKVEAGFYNLGERRLRRFDLVREDGRWVIDDVALIPENGRLSAFLRGRG